MAIQFNLLPDVKLEYDKAQRAQRLVYTVSFLAIAAVVALFIVSFLSVNVLQKKLLSDANANINNYSQKLKSIPNLEKILTIQTQLNSLPALHQQKHYVSRLFTYLPEITPANANIGDLNVDTTVDIITISGVADTVQTVNKFVDTIKFTSYTLGDDKATKKLAFSSVVLTKVDRDDKGANYTITASFDPALFVGAQNIKLIVPQETTTRSVLNSPTELFNGQTGTKPANQQGVQ